MPNSLDLSTLSARLKLLKHPTFKQRYIYRNIAKATQAFLWANYKAKIASSPISAIYLVPLLILRKALYILESKAAPLHAKILSYPMPQIPTNAQKPMVWVFVKAILWAMLVLPCRVCKSLLCALLAPLSGIMRARIYARFLLGKVDMPYFELVLTTRCTLRCESCNNLMQYFDSKTAYTCTLSGIQSTLEALLERVDSIYWVRIIGGEPLLFKDIDKVVEILDSSSKVKSFDIVTNATIIPKPRLLEALQASSKCFVSISDYTKSPNLSVKLHIQKLQDLLSVRKIPHSVLWQEATAAWFSPGQIYKRGRDRQGIEANFRSCLMPCVSVMSHESLPKLIGGGGNLLRIRLFG